jgi:hypothetical protein
MSLTDVQIINNGLSGLGQSRIRQIAPPITPLEQYCAARYSQQKLSELAKRRWVFAWAFEYVLTLSETLTTGTAKPYKYALPADCARPMRTKYSEWEQRGRFVYSAYSTLSIDYIRNVTNAEFDPLFNDVLSCRIRMDSAEYVTQSNAKKMTAKEEYKEAVADAAKVNAFIIGPEDIQEDDSDFSWVGARHNPGMG